MEETAAEETASVDEPVETSAEKRRAQALDDYPAAALRRVELRASGPTRGEGATPIELRAGESSSPQRRSAESQEAIDLQKLEEDDETLLESLGRNNVTGKGVDMLQKRKRQKQEDKALLAFYAEDRRLPTLMSSSSSCSDKRRRANETMTRKRTSTMRSGKT